VPNQNVTLEFDENILHCNNSAIPLSSCNYLINSVLINSVYM